jgi:hypothetical protein
MHPCRSRRQIKRDSSHADQQHQSHRPRRHRHRGAQGIGQIVGQRFLDSGARLVIWDVNPDKLASTGGELQAKYGAGRVKTAKVDIADYGAVERAVADIVQL